MTAPIVYQADDHDHQTQDRDCDWCGDILAQARYVYGPGGIDVYHLSPCWDEVSQAAPETEAVA